MFRIVWRGPWGFRVRQWVRGCSRYGNSEEAMNQVCKFKEVFPRNEYLVEPV